RHLGEALVCRSAVQVILEFRQAHEQRPGTEYRQLHPHESRAFGGRPDFRDVDVILQDLEVPQLELRLGGPRMPGTGLRETRDAQHEPAPKSSTVITGMSCSPVSTWAKLFSRSGVSSIWDSGLASKESQLVRAAK